MGNIVDFSKHKSLGKPLKSTAEVATSTWYKVAEEVKDNPIIEIKSSKLSMTDDKSLYAYYQLTQATRNNHTLDQAARLKSATLIAKVKSINNQQLLNTIAATSDTFLKPANVLLNDVTSEKLEQLIKYLQPTTYICPRKQSTPQQWELICHLTGIFDILFFDEIGILIKRMEVSNDKNKVIEIPANIYYTFIGKEPSAYLKISYGVSEMHQLYTNAVWAVKETSLHSTEYLQMLSSAKIGQRVTDMEFEH